MVPERIRLARHSAEDLLGRRGALMPQTGLLVGLLGLWVADRSLFRTIFTVAWVVFFAAITAQAHRDARRAQQFLEEHPVRPA